MILEQVTILINRIEKMEVHMLQGLTDLQNEVTALATVVGSVKTLVSGLQAQITQLQATIAAGGDNDADVEAQAVALKAQVDALNGIVNPVTPTTTTPPAV
jgi:hypothetical protein